MDGIGCASPPCDLGRLAVSGYTPCVTCGRVGRLCAAWKRVGTEKEWEKTERKQMETGGGVAAGKGPRVIRMGMDKMEWEYEYTAEG